MKIGIITLPLHTNYGGILQAYALQTILKQLGYESECIEVKKADYLLPIKFRYFIYLKRFIKNLFVKRKGKIFLESYNHKTEGIIRFNTNQFIRQFIRQRFVSSISDISCDDYSGFIVGSDQIWRSEYICRNSNLAPFLDFTLNWHTKRIAYACSFAHADWRFPNSVTSKLVKLVSNFDAVSVREDTGVILCEKNLHTTASLVLDPTMLLQKEDYIAIVKRSNVAPSTGNLLCYILDESLAVTSFIQNISSKQQMVPFRVNSKVEDLMASLEERIQPSVEQWLRGFMDAELVVTDSFHACVFSIIFNKPFICLGNKNRGMARFQSLLGLIGQNFRLVDNFKIENPQVFMAPDVDLLQMREFSLNFLKENLPK